MGTMQSVRLAMHRTTIASIKQYVESHLDSSDLSVETLCARSGWSRATTYRLFEPDGGLAHYIQQRRMQRAFAELISGGPRSGGPRRRILDIALESHFASEATFNRAFRRTYGIPPGELRTLAGAPEADAGPAQAGMRSDDDRALTVRWIKQLGKGSASPGAIESSGFVW